MWSEPNHHTSMSVRIMKASVLSLAALGTLLCFTCFFILPTANAQEPDLCPLRRNTYISYRDYTSETVRYRYHKACGFWNWGRCTAYRTTYKSASIWRYRLVQTYYLGTCEVFCDSGGTECECSELPNCDTGQRRCTSKDDHRCLKCEHDYGGDLKAYALLPRKQSVYPYIVEDGLCQPRCSWISRDLFCYPGQCHPDGPPSTCNCTAGFSGKGCLTISNYTIPLQCFAQVMRVDRENVIDKAEAECMKLHEETQYVNDPGMNRIEIKWTTYFRGAERYPTMPVYVQDFKVGVIYSFATLHLLSSSVQENTTHFNTSFSVTRECSPLMNNSADNPSIAIPVDCLISEDTGYPFQNGDVLLVTTSITNGGYLDTVGFPNVNQTDRTYYEGLVYNTSASFTFDFEEPYHCFLETSCDPSSLLDRGPSYTKEPTIDISWSGWLDDISQVHHYEIHVLPTQSNKGILTCSEDRSIAEKWDGFAPSSNCSVNISDPGVYCVLLTVTDKVGNHDNAMRYLMFDNVNTPHIDNTGHYPITVESAAQNTSYKWITSSESKVQVQWYKHFLNEVHKNTGQLDAIDDYSLDILPAYDELTGQPPDTRSREAIPNAHGIVKFEVAFRVDQQGGESLTAATTWSVVDDVEAEKVDLDISHQDGDTIRIWIKGYDVMGNTVVDNVTVHSDSTPPEIGEIYLTRDGVEYLAVHDSEDLYEMTVIFDAFDDHCGLLLVHWKLFDMVNNSLIHGDGHLPVVRPEPNNCNPPECTCIPLGECYYRNFTIKMNKELMSIPIGSHDYDYVFSMTVTNNAMLQRNRQFQITVDKSPPHEGSVHDSLPNYPDIDFQQSLRIFASWNGFFDREGGILLYVYYFGTDCFYDNEIMFPVQEPLFTTTSTQAAWTAPSPGRYHCTVIAYNRAMAPSNHVCSDGVTVDVSEPFVTDVVIDDVYVRPGLVNDGDGTVWFIDENRYRQEVQNAPEACMNVSRFAADFDLYPRSAGSPSITLNDSECLSIGPLSTHAFLRKENHLTLNWHGEDAESGIFDYEVGLSSAPSGLIPDILPFTSTKSHPNFLTYHPNLGEGVEFYVVIKAINRAELVANEFVGPLVVEVTPPEFDGEITVALEDDDHRNSYLVARWSQDAFFDDDDLDPLQDYQVAVGEVPGDTSVVSYVPLSTLESDICEVTVPPSCVAVPTDMLDWHLHGEETYYISIKVTNVAGLSVVASSLPYRHVVLLPREGIVYDIASPDERGVSFKNVEDIDFQTSVTDFLCWWTGFSHPDQDVGYRVALGTLPGLDNVVNFTDVDSSISSYSFEGLSLNTYQRYFVTVEAESELGSVSVSSDGVIVISDGDSLTDTHVYDGLSCDKLTGPNDTASDDSIHNDYDRRKACLDDVNFQASVTTVNAHWTVPENMTEYVTELKWALQIERVHNRTVKVWDYAVEYKPVQRESDIQVTGMTLRPGGRYRSIIKFCHPAGCFQPMVSSGFWVTPYPPVPFGINEVIFESAVRELSFTWKSFKQEEFDEGITEDAIDYYEWSINVLTSDEETEHGHLILPWHRINATYISDQLHYTTTLAVELDFSDCLRLGLRGYNKAGLSSTVHKEIKDCSVVGHIIKNVVIDAVGEYDDEIDDVRDVELSESSEWKSSDAEYTRSKRKLSAVWPGLGHGNFSWKVISDQTLDRYAYQKPVQHIDYDSYACSSPDVEACNETNSQYVNVDGLQLQHGWRYYICLHANETVTYRGNIKVILPEVSACSDGIVADHTPPTIGTVTIGREDQKYQTSSSSLIVHWEGFYDVEEHGRASHGTGIKKYEIAIGSFPGGVDVQDYQSVGILNWIVVTGLNLQGGLTYYATVRAMDYVGLISEAVSVGITVDVTPPVTSDRSIDLGGHFITSTSSIAATWIGLFTDDESGIFEYEWCVGSKPYHSDVYPCTSTEQQSSVQSDDEDRELIEGHVYYIMVKAYNGAGLSTAAVSLGVLVDASPPYDGFVYDGVDETTDNDYQTHLDYLAVHWGGFYDPHSSITGYSLKIGTCLNCDDVMREEDVGYSFEMRIPNLNLEPGLRYYATVTACNAAGLCTTVTSDGIIPDNSPPISGKVYDGVSHGDQAFQFSRASLSAHWYNFHDPHSQLSHYELRAGTTPGGNDTLPRTRLHLTEKAFTSKLPSHLQVATPIYVTVTAYNKAGLYTEQSSNGIVVDVTPPSVIKKPTVDNTMGSIFNGTQVWVSLLTVSWEFYDPDSPIETQLLSVSTHRQSDMTVPSVKVQGNLHQYTFTNLSLHDGNTYYVHVIACNAAKLCTSSDTDDIFVDSSPPTVGTFAVETDHAAGLTRHREGWMTYHQSQGQNSANVKLAWLGFADIHTGIRHYHVGVGSRYASWDMTGNITVQVPHYNGTSHFDEGSIQTAIIDITRDLVPGEHIYCTLWAVNEVGLRSYEAHETFVVTKSNDHSGILSLLRRCEIQTCQGDCTCAPQNQPCVYTPDECFNVKGNGQYQQVEIFDVIDYRDVDLIGDVYQDVNFTVSRCALAARWRTLNDGTPIQRYEWSVGSKGTAPGTGLLDPAFDRVWHDAGLSTFDVFTVRDISLNSNLEYVFYVKAWYDDMRYAIFTSDGIKPDNTPPATSTSRKVKDVLDLEKLVDIDFSTSQTYIGISWRNVFSDRDSDIREFSVSIGTHVGGEDVISYSTNTQQPEEYKVMLTGLNLQPGFKYYSNVKAVNNAGLTSIASSDGFMIDTAPPEVGVVHDGLGIHDSGYQNSSNIVAASWHGFSDLQSSIHHYMWCVGTTPGAEDILSCENVGLRLSMVTSTEYSFDSGQSYYSKVTAVDAAGLQSEPSFSNGITVDTTAPEAVETVLDVTNLIGNPSFEEFETGDGQIGNDTDCNDPEILICLPTVWQVQGTGHVFTGSDANANSGNAFMNIYGSVSQTVVTTVGGKYKISFYASHLPGSTTSLLSQEGYIRIPGVDRVFKLFQRSARTPSQLDWYEHVYYFTSTSEISNITIGSFGEKSGISLDDVHLYLLHSTSEQESSESPDPVHVHLRTDGKEFFMHASWDITDPESPVVDYMVAIGTLKGGTQLQEFRSVGRSSQVSVNDLSLTHGVPIYVTVVAKNAADLTAVFYSEPIMVDITPPDICCIGDGPNEDEDLTYQTSSVISVHWRVSDPESGIEYCEWAVGRAPSSSNLSPFIRTETLHSATVDLENLIHHAETVYCTVRCKNFIGLFSEIVSSGVTIVKETPHSHDATLRVVISSPTIYDARESHQTDVNSIRIAWDGFSDLSGISHFESNLVTDKGSTSLGSRIVGDTGENTAVLTGLALKSYKSYQIQLRAVNYGGFKSEPVISDVTIETCPPYLTGHDVHYSWSGEGAVRVDWTEMFISNSSLTYELSISSIPGGSNILKWFETRIPTYQLTGVDPSLRYYLTIVAANEAGLFEIYNTDFSYS